MNQNYSVFMKRCISLAYSGLGKVQPNPMVGSVVVYEEKILGEGYHENFGENHAEVNAIENVNEKQNLAESTLYVSLEPCAHYGKTPPCTEKIISSGIKKVVIGSMDPNPLVNGKGVAFMRDAGIEVITDIEEDLCRHLNQRYFCHHLKKRPFIILKWAQTFNGKISPLNPQHDKKISNEITDILVHKWRTEEQSIMVGTNTALADNPRLTSRNWPGKDPIRILFDRHGKIPGNFHFFKINSPLIIFTEFPERFNVGEPIKISYHDNVLNQVMFHLHQRNIQSVIVEGGGKLLKAFIEANLWDEAKIITSDKIFKEGMDAPPFPGIPSQTFSSGATDIVSVIYNNRI